MRRLLAVITLSLFSLAGAFCQSLPPDGAGMAISEFRLDQSDITANLEGSTVIDHNGSKCALFKIRTIETGFAFSFGISKPCKIEYKTAEVWVYVPWGVKRMTIQHPRLGTLEYDIPIQIDRARTYKMNLVTQGSGTVGGLLLLDILPEDAIVVIDSKRVSLDTVMKASDFLSSGKHRIEIRLDDKRNDSAGEKNDTSVAMVTFPNGKVGKYEYVDLGLSVKWAFCNIGASKPEEYGSYFAWGDLKGQTWNGKSWSRGGFIKTPYCEWDENNNLMSKYDAAHSIMGKEWRMPTKQEMQELLDCCIATWTSDYNGSGVAGTVFTSKKEGFTDHCIFLPAAGCGYGKGLGLAGSMGRYWSSGFYGIDYSWYLRFVKGVNDIYNYSCSYGQPIRAVCK